jgi:hypothetical protein
MRSRNTRSVVWQCSSLSALSAVVLVSIVMPPPVSADSLQQTRLATEPTSHSQAGHATSNPQLPLWACPPPSADLDRNLHHDRLAQFWHIQHSPPPAYLPSECTSDVTDDIEEDDTPHYRTANPSHRPVPTNWLMLGYSRLIDIPTSPPTRTMTRGNREHDWVDTRATSFSDASIREITASCATARGKQLDWMQNAGAQIMGALTLFLMLVLITEGARSLWRNCICRRSIKDGRGMLTLEGDEKQLRAFASDAESRHEDALTNTIFPT